MRKLLLGSAAFLSLITTPLTFAMEMTGTIPAYAIVNQPDPNYQGEVPERKEIKLMAIKYSPEEYQAIINYQPPVQSMTPISALPASVNLGMANVPVLDQGQNGTCTTFAVTAAINALAWRGDYISQLCHLELGAWLSARGYIPSGWNGAFAPYVLSQIKNYGIVTKATQNNVGCAGVRVYPYRGTGVPMSLDEFRSKSSAIPMNWQPLLLAETRSVIPYNAEAVFQAVKSALVSRFRVVFAASLPLNYCSVGACARYRANFDTWALTNAIKRDPRPSLGGHEMVIMGYDDFAVAVDNEGVRHQGLFILRNSWSTRVGDNGNYYMTYDFFKKYLMEAMQII